MLFRKNRMDWLNYHHLHYFWLTAREGSLTRAARRLRLSPSTLSEQIRTLERSLGVLLFDRSGRSLVLTDTGRVVRDYADDIFALGQELQSAVSAEGQARHSARFRVGVASNLPKLVAYRLLAPSTAVQDRPVHLVCQEGTAEDLVADLAVHHLDLVLADVPVPLAHDVHAESVLLGQTTVTMCATERLAERYATDFPASLDHAPLLLPALGSPLRSGLDAWLHERGLRPRVVAEFDDSALLKSFASEGAGLVPIATISVDDVARQYGLRPVGELSEVEERIYAILMPRRRRNPSVRAVLEGAARVLSKVSS